MQFEILTREEFEKSLIGFKAEILREIKSIIVNKNEDEWLNGENAMILINCKSTKLSELTTRNIIRRRGTGKGSRYSKNSITAYLNR
ncbi:hypothetical protein ACVWYG_003755 [Pedobacter sp. UYEF25]